ncbi:MAG: hypothetical protein K6F21_05110 [Bacteroidales bacterium]|nr:hypothetical protein [Bacteroidales bacterium]
MKYLKLIIAAVAAITLFQGCTKEYITKQYVTNEYNGAIIYTTDYNVLPGDWKKNEGADLPGSDNYYYATFDNENITDKVIALGTVHAYIYAIYDQAQNLGSWNPLPFVYPVQVTNDKNEIVVIPENTRFEYELGKVTFILQDLDGYDAEAITNGMSIRVCVTI